MFAQNKLYRLLPMEKSSKNIRMLLTLTQKFDTLTLVY